MCARARPGVCVCVCVRVFVCLLVCACACACERATAASGNDHSQTFRRPARIPTNDTDRVRERGCRSTGRCSASERARIQTNLGGGPNVPKRPLPLQPLEQPRRRRSRERPRPRRVVGRDANGRAAIYNGNGLVFALQIGRNFCWREQNVSEKNPLGSGVENGLARRRRPNSGCHTGAWRATERVDVRATPRRQPTGRRRRRRAEEEEKKLSRRPRRHRALSYALRATATLYRFPFHRSAFPRVLYTICIIISATKKMLVPQSLHNDYYNNY